MKKAVKIWLITAAVLVVAGLLMMIGALAAVDFDIKQLSTVEFETNTYKVSEKFENIIIEEINGEIELAPAEGKDCTVVCREPEKTEHSVSVNNGILTIKTVDDRAWFDRIGLIFESPKVTVYLPKKEYKALMIKNETGSTAISDDFIFESVTVSGSTGSVKCAASVKDELTAKLSTGNIEVKDADCGEINVETVTGNVKLDSVNVKKDINAATTTGNIKMTDVIAKGSLWINTTTGNVHFDGCDAKDLSVTATTGNIKGSLLSEKIFFAHSDTGKVNVPHTSSGGECELNTNTGNIEINIK